MIVKSQEWIDFKQLFYNNCLIFFDNYKEEIFLPNDADDFYIYLPKLKLKVFPIFTRREDFFKVEYDFSDIKSIKFKKISFSKFVNANRIEFILKD
jgi:hypothetical protein